MQKIRKQKTDGNSKIIEKINLECKKIVHTHKDESTEWTPPPLPKWFEKSGMCWIRKRFYLYKELQKV